MNYSGIFAIYFDCYCTQAEKEWSNKYFKNDHNKYLLLRKNYQQSSNDYDDYLDGNIMLANNLYLGNQGGKIVGNNDAPVNLGGMIYFFITKKNYQAI